MSSGDLEGFATIPRAIQRDPDVTWQEKVTYLALSSRANARNQCWPSIPTIAKDASCSESAVRRALDALRERRVLSWQPDPDGKPGRTVNIYTLGAPAEGVSARHPGGVSQTAGGCLGDTQTIEGNDGTEVDVKNVQAAPEPDDRPDVAALCDLLADRIEGNGSKRPNVTKAWRTDCRLMLDRDGRTVDQVRHAITWCQDDPFWRSNILSMGKLRQKYDQMRLQAQNRRPTTSPRQQDTDDLFQAAAERMHVTTTNPKELIS